MKNGISFLGGKRSSIKVKSFLTTPVKGMKPSPLFMKESITKTKRLNRYGDADMDGSLNFIDCAPRNPGKDGVVADFINKFRNAREGGNSSIEFKKFRKDIKNLSPEERAVRYKMYKKEHASNVRKAALESSKRFSPSGFISGLAGGLSYRPSKIQTRARRRFAGRLIRGIQAVTPTGTVPAPTGKTGTGKKGRPRGPSGKYLIPGVGYVGVYEYRAWLRQRKKLARLERHAPSSQVAGAGSSFPQSAPQQESIQAPQQAYLEESAPQDVSQDYQEQTQESMPQTMQTQQQPQNQMTPEQMHLLQLQMQQRDNILLAPVILKGELKNTATGSILDERGRPNVLQAPNAFLGQLRNLKPREEVQLGEKPITNPYGEYFTTIDPISGNPILRKRISEKWLDGRAI